MILLIILALMLLVLATFMFVAVGIGGAAFIVVFGDVIVCAVFIVLLIKHLTKKRTKKRK